MLKTLQEIQWCSFILYQKRNFKGALTNEKFTGISVWIAQKVILKKINISLTLYICLGKYSFRLNIFSAHYI